MLRSHNQQELEFDFFISFLEHAIKGKTEYENLIKPIIFDAADLVNNQKEIKQLNRIGLSVKILLYQKAPELLKDLDKDNALNNSFLEKILVAINSNRNLVLA